MAAVVSLPILAINHTSYDAKVEGIAVSTIKKVMPTWNSGNWIGTNKPSNYEAINSQLIVAKDAISADTDNYYLAEDVAEALALINA